MAYTAQSWDTIVRQVLHKGNLLKANSALSLSVNYVSPGIGLAEIEDRGNEFVTKAVEDSLLNAADKLIRAIAMNPKSIYRTDFVDTIDVLVSGEKINTYTPSTNTDSKRIGVIGKVYAQGDPDTLYTFKPYLDVINRKRMESLRQPALWYNTDNDRIWFTEDDPITAEIIVWDKETQRAALSAIPRGNCPFPEDLHEALVNGALGYIFKEGFNENQSRIWRGYFEETLAEINPDITLKEKQLREIDG